MKLTPVFKISMLILISLSSTLAIADMVAVPATSPVQNTTNTTNSPSTPVSDAQVTVAVQNKLNSDPALTGSSINVSTQNGIVTLLGSASSQQQINEAISTAKSVGGVSDVKSNVVIINGAATPTSAPRY